MTDAWTRTLKPPPVAVPRGKPLDTEIRWCMAESVWRFAEANGLIVQSFREVDPLRPVDVPASAAKKLGGKPEDFDWHVFEAVVTRA